MSGGSVTRPPLLVEFAPPCDTLNMNDRRHWAVKAEMTKHWRSAARLHTRIAAHRADYPLPAPRCEVHVSFPVRSPNARRDAHNWFPTVKAIIDGFVDAGVWPDDSGEYVVTVEPSFHATRENPFVVVAVTPARGVS